MNDLITCNSCEQLQHVRYGSDVTVIRNAHLCPTCSNYLKVLLQLNINPRTLSITGRNGSATGFIIQMGAESDPDFLPLFGGVLKKSSYLSDDQIKLLLAPQRLQDLKIEVNEFIS